MSTVGFIAALVGLIGVALFIRLSRLGTYLALALFVVLAASLLLMTLGVKSAGWPALVTTFVFVFVAFPFGGLGDG